MAFWNACSGVLTVFCLGLLGYLLARGEKIPESLVRILPRIVTTIVLPPYLLRNITSTFEREQLLHLVYGLAIPFISIFAVLALATLIERVMRVRPGRRGVFRTAFATSSTMNIGLPINVALFGDVALPYVLLYFLANAVIFWTLGNYFIAHDGESADVKLFSKQTLKQVCSPPLMGFLLGIALVLFDVHLPDFLDKSFKYVGDMAIALSLMYIGVMLNGISFSEIHLGKDEMAVFAGRFLLSPVAVLLLSFVFTVPPLMRNVFIIQASLPVMMNLAILSGYYKADVKFGTIVTSVSTLISLVTIPLYMVLIATFL
ncbi:MAG: hypothetical protein DELT_02512 [Desulfovibrio sp.]